MVSFAGVSNKTCTLSFETIGKLTLVGKGELCAASGFFSSMAAGFDSTTTSFFTSAGVVEASGLMGSGPLAELRLVSSSAPWAKRHFSLYLQFPFSLQFLHISYLRRLITVEAVADDEPADDVLSELELFSEPTTAPVTFPRSFGFSLSRELFPERDCEEGLPKLCSARG